LSRAVWLSLWPVLMAGCAAADRREFSYPNLPVIKLANGIAEILASSHRLDSPAFSADGNRLVVQLEIYRDPVLPYEVCSIWLFDRDDSGVWRESGPVSEGVYKKLAGEMALPVQPSFDETGRYVILTQIRFFSVLSIPWLSTLRSWVERVPTGVGRASRLLEHADWDMRATELLQHARVSPDGRWLAFYTREHVRDQGIHLLDLRTGEHLRLSRGRDKHPTWSADGKRIYFHCAAGGRRRRFDPLAGTVERSVLGLVDLRFDDGRLVGWERRRFDEFGDDYVYHKHPAEVASAGLLFFHGQLEPDGDKKLMVRRTDPGSQVFIVEPRWKGKKLKEIKHVCSALGAANLGFVAKVQGEKGYRHVFSLTREALEEVCRAVRPPT